MLYEDLYCARGNCENDIKAVKNDLHSDRTSATSFLANAMRLLLALEAYVYGNRGWCRFAGGYRLSDSICGRRRPAFALRQQVRPAFRQRSDAGYTGNAASLVGPKR